jgi:S1-C subfamily serine protease
MLLNKMRNYLIITTLLLASCCSIGVRSTEEATDCPWQLVGSGTLIPIDIYDDHAVFLTAAHVADFPGDLMARHRDGRILLSGRVLFIHPTEDAALISFPLQETPVSVLCMDFSPLRYGDRVVIPGFQSGIIWVVEGIVADPWRCSAPMFSGGSGAPVLDDRGCVRGIVVAVAAFKGQLIYHHCYMLPLFEIKDWIEECLESRLNWFRSETSDTKKPSDK